MIKQLAHVCLIHPDLAKAEHFYCNILGMKKRFDFVRECKPAGFYLEAGNGTYIEVFQGVPDAVKPGITHFCLETDSIDEVEKKFAASGYPLLKPKTMGRDGSWQCWAEDPAGIRFEFHEYTAASCQKTGKNCDL